MTQKLIAAKRNSHAILFLVFLMACLAGILFWQIGRFQTLTDWADQTDQIISEINLAERLIIDLQTGVRGFVITGDPVFLEPYYQSEIEIPKTINRLQKLIQDDSQQKKHIERVLALLEEWESNGKIQINLKKSNIDSVPLIKTSHGEKLIRAIRTEIEEMRTLGVQLKTQRVSLVRTESEVIFWILMISFVIILFELLWSLREQKLSEEELRNSEEKYRNLIVNSLDGIIVIDENGKIEIANYQIEKMFGYSLDELLHQTIEILVPDRFSQIHAVQRAKYNSKPIARGMGVNLDLYGQRKDKSEFPVSVLLSPVKTGHGTFVTATVRDITEQKKIEEERTRFLMIEKKANQVKDEFLAILSHELRTPLSTILSWVQLLRTGKLDVERTKHGLEVLERNAKAQGELIDDLLDISRIKAGKLKLNIQKIDPAKVISAAVDSARTLTLSKSIQVETTMDQSINYILADPVRLQQILWNLIANSIKFSSQGGKIWITLESVSSSAGAQVRIQVRDNGKGIKADFIPVIFDRFTQIDSTSTRSYGGLGLGLSIVRNLVEMHKGTVIVESPGEGKGATFTITLPVHSDGEFSLAEVETNAESETKIDIDAEVSLSGLRILLVDDEENAREVFDIMLKSFGAEVKTVESATEVLASIEDYKPDVLVSDIAMPIEDGYSLISKIRAMKTKQGQIPALALTAYAGQADIQRAYQAGFQAHLAKPVVASKLAQAIAKLAGGG